MLHDENTKQIRLKIEGDFENSKVPVLMPAGVSKWQATLHKKNCASTVEKINPSHYVIIHNLGAKKVDIEASY